MVIAQNMRWQNLNGENKVFIDDNILNNSSFEIKANSNANTLIITREKKYDVIFSDNDMYISYINNIVYNRESDIISLTRNNDNVSDEDIILMKQLDDNEIIQIRIVDDDIAFNIFKLPMFMTETNFEDTYPKFDINISNCTYSMKIYYNDVEYIDVPYDRTHFTMCETLNHLSNLVFYLQENSDFLLKLTSKKSMNLLIYTENHNEASGGGNCEFELAPDGIVLFNEIFDDGHYLVEWNKFFKLVIDGTWEIDFED